MGLRNYEIILVGSAALTDDEANGLFEKFKGIISEAGGGVKFESTWGRRRLAYAVQKQSHGIYKMLYAEAKGAVVEELERQCSYDDQMIKYFIYGVDDLETAYNDFEALKENPQKNSELVSEVLGA